MPTTQQLVRKGRNPQASKSKAPALMGKPQARGVVVRVFVVKPKKPNSANRNACRVRLTTGITVSAYIPGIGHNLTEHAQVLVRGGTRPDLPGYRYMVIRGVLDTKGDAQTGTRGHRQARSKYGNPIPKEKGTGKDTGKKKVIR